MKNILHLTLLGLIICSFNVNGQVSQSSLTFDGTNDYVDITTYQNMSPTSAVTVEAWINGGIPSSTAFIYDRVEQNDGFGLTVNASGNARLTLNGGQYGLNGTTVVTDNTWHHIAVTYDQSAGETFTYVDGVAEDSSNYSSLITYSPEPRNGIGGNGLGNFQFAGQIDEVRVWNYARSASQISAYKDSCLPSGVSGLIGYWKLDEGSGTLAADGSGNGNDGTLLNGPIWSAGVSIICAGTCTDTIVVYDTTFITVMDTTIVTVYDTIVVYDSISITDTLVIDVIISVGPPLNQNTIKVYPNPAKDQVIIQSGDFNSMNTYTVKIINNLSQEVFSSLLDQQSFVIDVTTFGATGVYFIQIIEPGGQVAESRKLILE